MSLWENYPARLSITLLLPGNLPTFCNDKYVVWPVEWTKARKSSLCCTAKGLGRRDIRSSSIRPKALALLSAFETCKNAWLYPYYRLVVVPNTCLILTNFDLTIACRDRDVFYTDWRQEKTRSTESANTRKRLIYREYENDCKSIALPVRLLFSPLPILAVENGKRQPQIMESRAYQARWRWNPENGRQTGY